ncbi:MAG: hypothetical protein Q8P67_02955, partial [archaeon]|nr:hypothetical protein [archaeon]
MSGPSRDPPGLNPFASYGPAPEVPPSSSESVDGPTFSSSSSSSSKNAPPLPPRERIGEGELVALMSPREREREEGHSFFKQLHLTYALELSMRAQQVGEPSDIYTKQARALNSLLLEIDSRAITSPLEDPREDKKPPGKKRDHLLPRLREKRVRKQGEAKESDKRRTDCWNVVLLARTQLNLLTQVLTDFFDMLGSEPVQPRERPDSVSPGFNPELSPFVESLAASFRTPLSETAVALAQQILDRGKKLVAVTKKLADEARRLRKRLETLEWSTNQKGFKSVDLRVQTELQIQADADRLQRTLQISIDWGSELSDFIKQLRAMLSARDALDSPLSSSTSISNLNQSNPTPFLTKSMSSNSHDDNTSSSRPSSPPTSSLSPAAPISNSTSTPTPSSSAAPIPTSTSTSASSQPSPFGASPEQVDSSVPFSRYFRGRATTSIDGEDPSSDPSQSLEKKPSDHGGGHRRSVSASYDPLHSLETEHPAISPREYIHSPAAARRSRYQAQGGGG